MSHTPLYVDTATSPATGARNVEADPINYGADWRTVAESNGEIKLTNTIANITMPETVRIAVADIADIFKGTDYSAPEEPGVPAVQAKRGKSVLLQVTGSVCDLDAAQNSYPYSAHLVLKVPTGAGADESYIVPILARLLGHLYATQATDISTRMAAVLRGALEPADL